MGETNPLNNIDNQRKILFFGERNCEYSNAAHKFLLMLGCEVKVVWSNNRAEVLPDEVLWWEGDYIFSFRNWFILPKN